VVWHRLLSGGLGEGSPKHAGGDEKEGKQGG
jgi:hypothetical protein